MQIQRGEASSCANPKIDAYTSIAGQLVNVAALEFAIDDLTGAEAIQIHPEAGWAEITVDAVCPDGHRLGLGHYVAPWTVPENEALGTHAVRWRAALEEGDAWVEWSEEFEVVAGLVLGERPGSYTSVERLRAEGVTEALASDARLADLIEEASREIDRVCRWWFEPRSRTLTFSGPGHDTIRLPAPVISISSVKIGGVAVASGWAAQGLAPVEDARKPRPELLRTTGAPWVEGIRNIEVVGVFGFTEADGTAQGRTPHAIRRACELMVLRAARPHAAEAEERTRGRVASMRTNRQGISFAPLRAGETAFDSDPEISRILAAYRSPARAGGV